MVEQHGYADDRDDLPVFIHSELDDYGLDPYQFRIYARIARRAGRQGAYESIKNMAQGCCMSEGKAKSSLRFLIEQGLVSRESREGYTSIYRLNPKSKWLPKKQLIGVDTEQPGSSGVHPPGSSGVHPPGSSGVHPPGSSGVHEGNPIKSSPVEVNPSKGSPKIPPIVPHVAAVVVEKEEGSVPDTLQISASPETLIYSEDTEIKLNKTGQVVKDNFYKTGKIPALNDYYEWIQPAIGNAIRFYRKNGYALRGDIDRNFLDYLIKFHRSADHASATKWITNCERDPMRWTELTWLVAAWKTHQATNMTIKDYQTKKKDNELRETFDYTQIDFFGRGNNAG
jgi:hypothetical protein